MSDQKESTNLQEKSNTTLEMDNKDSRKIAAELNLEDKTRIDSKSKPEKGILENYKESDKIETEQNPNELAFSDKTSKQDGETGNKESAKIGNTEQKLEDQDFSNKSSKKDDETYNKESGTIDDKLMPEDKIFIDNKPKAEHGESIDLKINNQESGTSNLSFEDKELVDNKESVGRINKNLLEDKTCIYNKPDLKDGLPPPTTTVEKHDNEMLPYLLTPLEKTVNNKKRYQNQNEMSNKHENSVKKIKIDVTNDNQFQEMWKSLQQNSSNFDGWVNILHVVNCQNNVVNARMTYSKFLELYPLCYGYWKKYANFEKRNNNIPEFKKVLENGLSAIPRSVDFWIYYMSYLRLERSNEKEHIRYEFDRSLKMCGFDYRSDQLWHDYISWEVEKNELSNAINLYYRLLRIPTSNYLKNFFKFQEFIFKKLPEKYLGLPDFLERRSLIIIELEQSNSRESLGEDSIPPGDDSTQIAEITEISIVSALRIQIIELWYSIHKQTAKEFESREIFEKKIRRNHFHVKKLESDQIKNWESYIKFEKKEGNHERIIFLYERCLITCVSNEGLWLNYLEYLSSENFNDTNLLVDVFKRSLFYHPKSLALNLKYFDFSEKKGWIEKAIDTITEIGLIYPNAKKVIMRMMNVARRNQDGSLKTLFEHHLKYPYSKSFSSYLAIKYARFVWKHDRQLNLAFDILNDTIRNKSISVNDNMEIYLMYVELQMELHSNDHELIIRTIDDIILQCEVNKMKLVFLKQKVEYIESYVEDYEILRLAKIEYKSLKSLSNNKKNTLDFSFTLE